MTAGSGDTRQLHDTMDFIGLRAHATSAGLLQLCSELVQAGIIGTEAVERIKGAVHHEIMISQARARDREEFATTLKERLDAIFPRCESAARTSARESMLPA